MIFLQLNSWHGPVSDLHVAKVCENSALLYPVLAQAQIEEF
jgi:hypothetical protein